MEELTADAKKRKVSGANNDDSETEDKSKQPPKKLRKLKPQEKATQDQETKIEEVYSSARTELSSVAEGLGDLRKKIEPKSTKQKPSKQQPKAVSTIG